MTPKERIFYFCIRGISHQFHFYVGWVNYARKKKIPINLLTTISFKEYFKLPPCFKKDRKFIFIPCFSFLDSFFTNVFLLFQILRSKKVIIQFRKRNIRSINFLKKMFPKKLIFIVEFEGDLVSEINYLIKYPYKKNFYLDLIKDKNIKIQRFEEDILNSDYLICVSENLKKLFLSRYSLNSKKIISLTTGCDSNLFHFDEAIRVKTRIELGSQNDFIMIYVGSIYFSWQNISRTLDLYKIAKKIDNNLKLIIIILKKDKKIIYDFLKKKELSKSNIILKFSIPNYKIPDYLNAADMGIIIRNNHPMNNVASPGNFGEYACCGLPIITGKGISNFSQKLEKTSYGIVLNNIYDDKEFTEKFSNFKENYKIIDRKEISNWGKLNFSFEAFIDKYISFINKIKQGKI